MINHPLISNEIAAARQHDLLAAAAARRLARQASTGRRSIDLHPAPAGDNRRPVASVRPAQACCAGR